jgi:2'-5' RNA ligase
MAQSAIVVVVEEAEPVVGAHRLRHDPVASLGVPAHVTILYPFRPVVDAEADNRLSAIARAIPPFEVTFAQTERFPEGVLYLPPEPSEPIRAIMHSVAAAFPDCPPYEGEIADPTPHLTIGLDLSSETADRLSEEIAPLLPVAARVERLTLLVEEGGAWKMDRHWTFGARPG